jgi:hypothetical protein
MKKFLMKLCINHNMSQHQKDCLERKRLNRLLVDEIWSECVNYSVYPRFVYTDPISRMPFLLQLHFKASVDEPCVIPDTASATSPK